VDGRAGAGRSIDLRARVVAAIDAGQIQEQAAIRFGVSVHSMGSVSGPSAADRQRGADARVATRPRWPPPMSPWPHTPRRSPPKPATRVAGDDVAGDRRPAARASA
jgi:hypothetical protein